MITSDSGVRGIYGEYYVLNAMGSQGPTVSGLEKGGGEEEVSEVLVPYLAGTSS